MIVGGIAQGLAFLPYTIATGLQELNRALVDAQAVTLDDAYRAGYGVTLDDPRVDQRTGEVRGARSRMRSPRWIATTSSA